MKPFRYLAAAVAAVAITLLVVAELRQPPAEEPPREGWMEAFVLNKPPRIAPGMTFRRGDGKTFRLADFRGRVVLVNFWATWCAPCLRELPALNRLETALGGKDFTVIAINVDRGGAEVAGPFLKKRSIKALRLYIDDKMALALKLGLKQMPTTFLLDREGEVVGSLAGLAEWDAPEAKALIRHYIRQEE